MLNFQAVLTNVKFDIDCRNVLYFKDREAQENYFSVASLFSSAQSINFNAGSLIETTIIYQVQENESINDLLSKNYCIIKDNSENSTLKYYYYFIKNIMQDSGNQLKVWLELDVFQTYFIDTEFSDCEILRAHLNRFVDNGDGTVSFDGGVNSELFEREDIQNVAKRLVSRKKISLYKNMTNMTEEAQKWMDSNIVGWIYAYLDQTHEFNITNAEGASGTVKFLQTIIRAKDNDSNIPTNLTAVCVPILRTGKKLNYSVHITFPDKTLPVIVNQNILETFMKNNNGAAYIYSMKISANPPFYNLNSTTTYSISEDGKTLTIGGDFAVNSSTSGKLGQDYSSGDLHLKVIDDSSDTKSALLYVNNQSAEIETSFDSGLQYKFNKSEIVGANKNVKYNPKLLSSDYMSINIGNENSNFEYDAQKINEQTFDLLYSEPLVADITKTYIRLKGKQNAIYNEGTSENFTGDVNSNDTSLVLITTAYQQMLANNKNYFLQNTINRFEKFAGGLLGTGLNIATGNYGAAAMGAGGAIGGLISSVINEKLTIDNLKASPASIQNAKGNIFLNVMSSEIGLIVEIYDILPNEKTIVNDYMCQYGYTVNKIGKLKDYLNTRKYYNYIEAEIQETSGINISKSVHDKFKTLFARGVRFWNVDTFSYDLENYEKWLEE